MNEWIVLCLNSVIDFKEIQRGSSELILFKMAKTLSLFSNTANISTYDYKIPFHVHDNSPIHVRRYIPEMMI